MILCEEDICISRSLNVNLCVDWDLDGILNCNCVESNLICTPIIM